MLLHDLPDHTSHRKTSTSRCTSSPPRCSPAHTLVSVCLSVPADHVCINKTTEQVPLLTTALSTCPHPHETAMLYHSTHRYSLLETTISRYNESPHVAPIPLIYFSAHSSLTPPLLRGQRQDVFCHVFVGVVLRITPSNCSLAPF